MSSPLDLALFQQCFVGNISGIPDNNWDAGSLSPGQIRNEARALRLLDIHVIRRKESDSRTLDELRLNGAHFGYSLEDPWLNNARNVSRIYAGRYKAFKRLDRQQRLELTDVLNRDNVQIHVGNTPGDTEGCILPGLGIHRGREVRNSAAAIRGIFSAFDALAMPRVLVRIEDAFEYPIHFPIDGEIVDTEDTSEVISQVNGTVQLRSNGIWSVDIAVHNFVDIARARLSFELGNHLGESINRLSVAMPTATGQHSLHSGEMTSRWLLNNWMQVWSVLDWDIDHVVSRFE